MLTEHPIQTNRPALTEWSARNSFTANQSSHLARLHDIKQMRGASITVAIPTLNESATIENICHTIRRDLMQRFHIVDRLLILDGGSRDETVARANAAGAEVIDVRSLVPGVAIAGGKGESLWRSLSCIDTDIVVWVDGDIRNFSPRFVTDLITPLLTRPDIDFVKGTYRRPLEIDNVVLPGEGGRVTELLARPLLHILFPELDVFDQPLAGEYAGRVEVLREIPFFTGYSVEAAMLIDLLHTIGIERMAQADLGVRVHRNRPLSELGVMATAISRTILQRAEAYGRLAVASSLIPELMILEETFTTDQERPAMSLVCPDVAFSNRHPAAMIG